MHYKDEAFIKMNLIVMPDTTFEDCAILDCNIMLVGDNTKTLGKCDIRNNIIYMCGKVL